MTAAEIKKEVARLESLIAGLDPKSPSSAQKMRRYKNKIKQLNSPPSSNRTGAFSREKLQLMQKAQTPEGRRQIAADKKKKEITKANVAASPNKGREGNIGRTMTKYDNKARVAPKPTDDVKKSTTVKRKPKEFGAMTDYMNAKFNRRK